MTSFSPVVLLNVADHMNRYESRKETCRLKLQPCGLLLGPDDSVVLDSIAASENEDGRIDLNLLDSRLMLINQIEPGLRAIGVYLCGDPTQSLATATLTAPHISELCRFVENPIIFIPPNSISNGPFRPMASTEAEGIVVAQLSRCFSSASHREKLKLEMGHLVDAASALATELCQTKSVPRELLDRLVNKDPGESFEKSILSLTRSMKLLVAANDKHRRAI